MKWLEKVNHDSILCSFGVKSSANEATAGKGGSRWRSDESSEDENDKGTYLERGASLGTRRWPRLSRR
jgi:E3 ubiquitin-protein ligase HOS1